MVEKRDEANQRKMSVCWASATPDHLIRLIQGGWELTCHKLYAILWLLKLNLSHFLNIYSLSHLQHDTNTSELTIFRFLTFFWVAILGLFYTLFWRKFWTIRSEEMNDILFCVSMSAYQRPITSWHVTHMLWREITLTEM